MHPRAPWTDVTFAGVYWQEATRLPILLKKVRPWFTNIVVGVQEGGDATLTIARKHADIVIEDRHHGFAEPTFSKVLAAIKTPWAFVISGDEMPSDDLLDSFQDLLNVAVATNVDGFKFKFVSTIDGIDFTAEQDYHMRLFRSSLRWPTTMHSEPKTERIHHSDAGHIVHARSLDEMMLDYISYYWKGFGDKGWEDHNKLMMRGACNGVAEVKGWDYVHQFSWWPKVEEIAYK